MLLISRILLKRPERVEGLKQLSEKMILSYWDWNLERLMMKSNVRIDLW